MSINDINNTTNAINNLTGGALSNVADTVNKTTSTINNVAGIANDISSLTKNGLSLASASALVNGKIAQMVPQVALAGSVLNIAKNLKKFMNAPAAVIDSAATSVTNKLINPKLTGLKSITSVASNLMKISNIKLGDMLSSAIGDKLKSGLSGLGVTEDMLKSIDVDNIESLEELEEKITGLVDSGELLTDKISDIGKLKENISGVFANVIGNDPTKFVDNIKNALNPLKQTALSEYIASGNVDQNFLKKLLGVSTPSSNSNSDGNEADFGK